METNPLLRIQEFDQSIWLDFIRRGTIISGELKQLINQDGLRGVTSNPAIFEKAITSTKNPAYLDVKYVEPLIGPDTVNSLPLEAINAYRDHGNPEARLQQDLEKA
jgi:transaldolase